MEMFKWFTRLVSILALMAVVIFSIQVGEITTYKNQVNYQIERSGGLTEEVLTNLTEYSNELYGGRFRVESPQLNTKVTYGETVDYTVIGTFKPIYFSISEIEIPSSGQAVSLIRP